MSKPIFIFQIDRSLDASVDVVSEQESLFWYIFWHFDDLEILPLDLWSLVVFAVWKVVDRSYL